jgi:cytochrome P460
MRGHPLPKVPVVGAAACLLAAACTFFQIYGPSIYGQSRAIVAAAAVPAPAYAANGDMLPVPNYREWIYLSSGLGMTYSPQPGGMTMFDNVFVNPEAYRSFVATGTWPDKTVMVLESRGAVSKGSINQNGHFQDVGVMGFAIHVKDEARFPGKWAFFSFNSPIGNGTLIPQGASCYTCHAAHGAVDTTFVQFYPTLLPIAQDKKTLSDAFLKEEAAPASASK